MSAGLFREASIDLSAYRSNIRDIVARVAPAKVLAVVKANGYGHGGVEVARAAIDAGATGVGVADIYEGLSLRAAGITAPILAWFHGPGEDFLSAVAADLELGISSAVQLEALVTAVRSRAGGLGAIGSNPPTRVHLKLDTGLSRNGAAPEEWRELFDSAVTAERSNHIEVVGLFSHLANTDPESNVKQRFEFERALKIAAGCGLKPTVRHLASTEAALDDPSFHYDMVRIGIGSYGIAPYGDARTGVSLGLRPVMKLRAGVIAVREVPAGAGVSYGHTWRAEAVTRLALVPLGYADGVPRQASNRASVWLNGKLRPQVGRIAMDQFLVDMGDDAVTVGDEVVVFGAGDGVPSIEDWARWADTIGYDIATGIGSRVPRVFLP